MKGHVNAHTHESAHLRAQLLQGPHRAVRATTSALQGSQSWRLPRKVIIAKSEVVHGTTLRALSGRAPARAPVDMHFEDLEVNECAVNSSNLCRTRMRKPPIKHPALTHTVRTPIVLVWGTKNTTHTHTVCCHSARKGCELLRLLSFKLPCLSPVMPRETFLFEHLDHALHGRSPAGGVLRPMCAGF